MKCVNHADSHALYECGACQVSFCEVCVQTFQAGTFNTFFCPLCQGQCSEIEPDKKPQSAPKPEPIEAGPSTVPLPPLQIEMGEEPSPVITDNIDLNKKFSASAKPAPTVLDKKESTSRQAPSVFDSAAPVPSEPEKVIPEEGNTETGDSVPVLPDLKIMKVPSLRLFYLSLFRNYDVAFSDALVHLRQSTPFRIRFIAVFFLLFSAGVFCRMRSFHSPFFLPFIVSISEWALFSAMIVFGISTKEKNVSRSHLGMFILGMESLFLFTRNFFVFLFLFFSLKWLSFIPGTLILIFKLKYYSHIFTRGLSCSWQNVLLTLASATLGSLFFSTLLCKFLS
jgi:hypothetical protein